MHRLIIEIEIRKPIRENSPFGRINSEYIRLYLIYNKKIPPGWIHLEYIKPYFMYNKKMLLTLAFSKPTKSIYFPIRLKTN